MDNKAYYSMWFFAIAVIVFLTGCHQHAMKIKGNQPEWTDEQARKQENARRQREQKLQEMVNKWKSQYAIEDDRYKIGAGDMLEVTVYGLKEMDEGDAITATVSEDGHIKLPWVGEVRIAGLTVEGAEDQVASAYEGNYLQDPQVSIRVAEYGSRKVRVLGAVGSPGTYVLEKNRTTILELLLRAGGVSDNAGDVAIIKAPDRNETDEARLSRTWDTEATFEEKVRIDLDRLFNEGDMSLNAHVPAGCMVVVPPARRQYFVIGYVGGQGMFDLRGESSISVVQALARSGGLAANGRGQAAYVVRTNQEKLKITPVDLIKVFRGEIIPPELGPGDGLVVGTTALARVGQYVSGGAKVGTSATMNLSP